MAMRWGETGMAKWWFAWAQFYGFLGLVCVIWGFHGWGGGRGAGPGRIGLRLGG